MDKEPFIHLGETSGIRYMNPQVDWVGGMTQLELSSFPTSDPEDLYNESELKALVEDFSEGCFVGFDQDNIVAMGLGIRVHFDLEKPLHTVHDIVPDNGTSGHHQDGDWYYGTSIAVSKQYRKRGIGNELYKLRKEVCQCFNLRGIVAGGVMPGYVDHKNDYSADEYIELVRKGELYDPTLTFQRDNGFQLVCALPNYIVNPEIDNNAALIVWQNPDYEAVNC